MNEPLTISESVLDFQSLRNANIERQKEWCPDIQPDLSFRGNELAGETGEACNVIKKLERERHGWRGSKSTIDCLAEELADVIIVADLIAQAAGVNLGEAVLNKFNATSDKNRLSTKLAINSVVEQLQKERDSLRELAQELLGLNCTSHESNCSVSDPAEPRCDCGLEQRLGQALSHASQLGIKPK